MIRVDIGPRLVRSARKLGPEFVSKTEEILSNVAAHFGKSHRHAGVGLRKLGRKSYEARVHLDWRIVFILEEERLTAYDLMDHDRVRNWLRGRKGG